MISISAKLPENVYKEFKIHCVKEGKQLQEVFRLMIIEYLGKQKDEQ